MLSDFGSTSSQVKRRNPNATNKDGGWPSNAGCAGDALHGGLPLKDQQIRHIIYLLVAAHTRRISNPFAESRNSAHASSSARFIDVRRLLPAGNAMAQT